MTTTTLELSLPVALSLFSDLIGRKVSGQETDRVDLSNELSLVRGVFEGEGGPAALYVMDVELAAATAAALVMMPAGLVRESVQEKTLLPMLVDNNYEVLNVTSRLINRAGGIHYKLRAHLMPGQPLAPEAAEVLESASQRIDLKLSVEGYGGGVLTILVK